MRAVVFGTCVVACLLAGWLAGADTLVLNPGRVDGTLEGVTILVDGKPRTYVRTEIRDVTASDKTYDSVTLQDGTKVQGELVSVSFRSIAGVQSYERANITMVVVTADKLADIRKEYAQRKEAVDLGDAKALFDLAKWCMDSGLRPEGAEWARRSLLVDAGSEASEAAHKLLGEVQDGAEWVTAAEYARRHPGNAGGGEGGEQAGAPDEKEGDDAEAKPDGKLTEEQVKQLKEMIAKNQELYKTYKEKAETKNKEDMDAVKLKYGTELQDTINKLRDLAQKTKDRDREVADDKARLRTTLLQQGVTAANADAQVKSTYDTAAWDKERDDRRHEIEKQRRNYDRLVPIYQAAHGRAQAAASRVLARVRDCYERNRRVLLGGKLLGEGDLTGAYEDALAPGEKDKK